jgi:hypothetical protein
LALFTWQIGDRRGGIGLVPRELLVPKRQSFATNGPSALTKGVTGTNAYAETATGFQQDAASAPVLRSSSALQMPKGLPASLMSDRHGSSQMEGYESMGSTFAARNAVSYKRAQGMGQLALPGSENP